MQGWDKYSVQKLPKNFIPLYPKDNDKVFVIHKYQTDKGIFRIETNIEHLKQKSIVEIEDSDMMVVNVIYDCTIKDGKLYIERANVDFDVNCLLADKMYYVTVDGKKQGWIYRKERQEIENFAGL